MIGRRQDPPRVYFEELTAEFTEEQWVELELNEDAAKAPQEAHWMEYADTGHGGNQALRELTETDTAYPNAFQYSLLHVFPKTLTRAEALILERQCKEKLGTRVHGLNQN